MSIAADTIATEQAKGPAAKVSAIRIRGARMHNLQNVDLDLPRNKLIVLTGVSGSGKSSLAFDTLLAEGQRQYIDSLSVYSRQFFNQRERPDVDLIEGLQPSIAIDQSQGSHSPRSTVGTITEVYDYLRLLYARASEVACAECGAEISQQSPAEIQEAIEQLPEQSRVMLLAPLVRGRKGKHAEVMEQARKAGFVRVRIDGETYPIEDAPELKQQKVHDIEAVVDRVVIREGIDSRLAESVRLALKHGEGVVLVVYQTPADKEQQKWQERLFNTQYACPNCKSSMAEVEPRTFSFNSPYGACQACSGLGLQHGFDPQMVLPDASLSLAGGAIAPWRGQTKAAEKKHAATLAGFLEGGQLSAEVPLAEWPETARQQLLTGDGKGFFGLLLHLEEEYESAKREATRERLDAFRGSVVCPDCEGSRLQPAARGCRVGERAIHEVTAMAVDEALRFFESLEFDEERAPIGEPLVREICRRLEFLVKSGANYLSLDRPATTLSGGELQRVRLATGIGAGLVGVMYLLDEPSIGLHPRDNDRLITAIRDLQQQGSTVIVVEHDEAIMRAADWVVDIGPGAGNQGGRVVAEGTVDQIAEVEESTTGRYLAGKEQIAIPTKRRSITKSKQIHMDGATLHNLQNVAVDIPLGTLTCVTGVSGSGKSSLVMETLAPALARKLHGAHAKPGPYEHLTGVAQIERCVQVDQSPIGRSPRSNAATYTGLFDEIRKVYAKTKLARQRGYKTGRFSFNVKGGRCEACQGQGQQKIEMNFLPNLFVECEVCRGARFNRQTLAVRYRDRSIADVLEMPVAEAVDFFENVPPIKRLVDALNDVGLGYLPIGQSSNTVSGGEAQRIKLASELAASAMGHTLYILDEPTTGLHMDDVRRLLVVLQKLVDAGNTVLVIEHHLDVMKSADWLIDFGPDGGTGGGQIVAVGTPEEVANAKESVTGQWLKPELEKNSS